MNKLFIVRYNDYHAYLEEWHYETHTERYEYLKDVELKDIFEPSELPKALRKVSELNYD